MVIFKDDDVAPQNALMYPWKLFDRDEYLTVITGVSISFGISAQLYLPGVVQDDIMANFNVSLETEHLLSLIASGISVLGMIVNSYFFRIFNHLTVTLMSIISTLAFGTICTLATNYAIYGIARVIEQMSLVIIYSTVSVHVAKVVTNRRLFVTGMIGMNAVYSIGGNWVAFSKFFILDKVLGWRWFSLLVLIPPFLAALYLWYTCLWKHKDNAIKPELESERKSHTIRTRYNLIIVVVTCTLLSTCIHSYYKTSRVLIPALQYHFGVSPEERNNASQHLRLAIVFGIFQLMGKAISYCIFIQDSVSSFLVLIWMYILTIADVIALLTSNDPILVTTFQGCLLTIISVKINFLFLFVHDQRTTLTNYLNYTSAGYFLGSYMGLFMENVIVYYLSYKSQLIANITFAVIGFLLVPVLYATTIRDRKIIWGKDTDETELLNAK